MWQRRPSGALHSKSTNATETKGTEPEPGEWWKDGGNEPSVCAGWTDVQTLVSHWEKWPEDWRKSVTAASKVLVPILAEAYPHREQGTSTLAGAGQCSGIEVLSNIPPEYPLSPWLTSANRRLILRLKLLQLTMHSYRAFCPVHK